jgi:hypothetical protein
MRRAVPRGRQQRCVTVESGDRFGRGGGPARCTWRSARIIQRLHLAVRHLTDLASGWGYTNNWIPAVPV